VLENMPEMPFDIDWTTPLKNPPDDFLLAAFIGADLNAIFYIGAERKASE
jgi:hypothetical protein